MSEDSSFELVSSVDSRPTPVIPAESMEHQTDNTEGRIVEPKINLNQAKEEPNIEIIRPIVEDIKVCHKENQTNVVDDDSLVKRLKNSLERKRLAASGSLNSLWKLKNIPTKRKNTDKIFTGSRILVVTVILVGLVATSVALFLGSGVSVEAISNKLKDTNKCILTENGGLVCSQELLQELMTGQPWAMNSSLVIDFGNMIFNSAKALMSNLSLPFVILMVGIISICFVTGKILFCRMSSFVKEEKLEKVPDSRTIEEKYTWTRLLFPKLYIISVIFSMVAIVFLIYWIADNMEETKKAEEAKLIGGKERMKQDFTDWLGQNSNSVGNIDLEFGHLKEFHRCKALEDIDVNQFTSIVDNMAKVMEISDDRKEEIQMAVHSATMVNVLEDFEHGPSGFYTYGKYQTLKRSTGNMDLHFALHAFKWKLDKDGLEERVVSNKAITMKDRTIWKNHFRAEAMKLFESDCPQQLVTELRLKERKREQDGANEDIKNWVRIMYENAKWNADTEAIKKANEVEQQPQGMWDKLMS